MSADQAAHRQRVGARKIPMVVLSPKEEPTPKTNRLALPLFRLRRARYFRAERYSLQCSCRP